MVANYQNVHFEPVTPMQQPVQENQLADVDQEGQEIEENREIPLPLFQELRLRRPKPTRRTLLS